MSATQHITQPTMPTQWPYLWARGCGEITPHVRPAVAAHDEEAWVALAAVEDEEELRPTRQQQQQSVGEGEGREGRGAAGCWPGLRLLEAVRQQQHVVARLAQHERHRGALPREQRAEERHVGVVLGQRLVLRAQPLAELLRLHAHVGDHTGASRVCVSDLPSMYDAAPMPPTTPLRLPQVAWRAMLLARTRRSSPVRRLFERARPREGLRELRSESLNRRHQPSEQRSDILGLKNTDPFARMFHSRFTHELGYGVQRVRMSLTHSGARSCVRTVSTPRSRRRSRREALLDEGVDDIVGRALGARQRRTRR
eukprot:6425690-Prymnesium_polylepis.1